MFITLCINLFIPSCLWQRCAAIFWDPNPTALHIPYLDMPLRWYGILFALGFIAAFLLLLPILKRKLTKTKLLLPRDIQYWPQLMAQLQIALKTPANPLHLSLSRAVKPLQQLINNATVPSTENERALFLNSLTQLFNENSIGLDRTNLEKLLPGCIIPLHSIAYAYIDLLLWFNIIGTVIGARLGHVFLYEWPRYSAHPSEIFKIWEGGLASHGGTLGVIFSVFLYVQYKKKEFPEITFLGLCDLLTIPAAFICICIRLGNFINQEILGTPTVLPWGFIFGHPADGSLPIARHPVQLYEAIAYMTIFIILWRLWKAKGDLLPTGFLTGLLFVLVFGSRFILEFFKAPQSLMIDESIIQTGQWLSLPFILAGIALMTTRRSDSLYSY